MTRPTKNLTGPIATGDALHFGSNDLDQVNYLFTGQDQSSTDPIDMNTLWKYRSQKLVLRDPTNTYSSTVVNPKVTTDSTFQFNSAPDMYVFIDPDDGNKVKARDGRTGAIISSHATNADVVFQGAINALSAGSAISTTSGETSGLWIGGKYGTIFIGPGQYYFYNGVIYQSNLSFIGSGPLNTYIRWPDNNLLGNHNQTMFRSSMWDSRSTAGGTLTAPQMRQEDINVQFKDMSIYGNYRNNVIPDVNTATTTLVGGLETAGTDSWGHGIAHYGEGLTIENVQVFGCPGAGIIIQAFGGSFGGPGYPYPVDGIHSTGGTGVWPYSALSFIRNVQSWQNGRQGLLLRADAYVDNYWSYFNGEAGIDAQQSAYFNGGGWIRGIECFLDGYKHGDQTSTTYDPLGFELRFAGWMSDAWIEAPYGPGDNLMIGNNGYGASNPTGYQIVTHRANGVFTNVHLDHSRWAAINIGLGSNNHMFKNVYVVFTHDAPNVTYQNITPLRLLGNNNDINLMWLGYNADVASGSLGPVSVTGIVLGQNIIGGSIAGNRLTLLSCDNDYALDWQHTANRCYVDLTMSLQGYYTQPEAIFKPGGATVNYAQSAIRIRNIGSTVNSVNIRESNGGLVTFSGTGSQLAFQVSHLLYAAPNLVNVVPNTTGALGNYTVTADATNVTITYVVAPPSGTNNVKFYWFARVSP